ncbi:hypothetical protein EPUS_07358 [Endocarpon pusillum Z07020]|uniref:GTPase-activating protein GYP5 n=1 Tax=Endocarpon pusillum (strain Z07020 / HMAS-L-300199) TaxID=1263415 RepID=U1GFI0_ENDPU|nr:uncharacterized protein EPUS_07358 [Endocarpon pusillum Z07020]ERF70501.1 hypothetical protein EPUS_07358 [Endocarpon pusillum Z07020]
MDTAAASSPENTDPEGETFEDAPDSASMDEGKPAGSGRSSSEIPSSFSSSSTPKAFISESSLAGQTQARNALTNGSKVVAKSGQVEDVDKSPLLTAHRMSTGSINEKELEEVQNGSAKSSSVTAVIAPTQQTKASRDVPPARPPPLPSRFTGFSASLPGVPWGGSSSKTVTIPPATPPTQSRKVTGPFAWLNRAASVPKEGRSPPLQAGSTFLDRRNTSVSVSTIGSNPELMLKTLDEGNETNATQGGRPPTKTTLRDRFKSLRMREEAGITSLDDPEKSEGGAIAGLIGRGTSLGVGVASPSSVADEKESGLAGSPITSPLSPLPPSTVNATLAPGTVSGISTAAQDAVTPIDWDFWQTVVNDGPQAVARTSPEELTQSIASGIPQTIRGVIWQVLAGSKNEDLEGVYQDLLRRGTDKEAKDTSQQVHLPNGHANGSVKEKEPIASSGSSVHSDRSTPATSTTVGAHSPAPSAEKNTETVAKVQAELVAERQKRVNEDAVALQKLEKMIKRDMGARTSYSKYAVAAGFQDGLFNVCKAYALFDDGVGYPQGMNFIIMPLLFTMPEEEAFCLLVRLMNKYGLRELFVQDMPGLHLHLYQFERLLEDLEPALYCHLNRRGVTPKLYATQWFLTLFAYRFPLQLVMRVFDLILSEGLEGAILKFGMAMVQRNVSTLLAMDDMAALTNFLKEKLFDAYIDQTPSNKSILESGFFGSSGGTDTEVYRADILVQDACSVKITPEMLKRYQSEWNEKIRTERDRETEIDNYRSTIATQAAKIRSLEERAEKSDTEHVQIATDLVRIKVENQELHDSNESLRGQVEELKKVVESEAAAVEARLKDEMERVMQRNIEVQNDNRLMEESMAEMEASLVETKMKYAEITENHETLKQKWNDLRKALD